MATVGIIDYGMGNLHAIAKALRYVASDERIEINYDAAALARMDRLVLPGVGAMRYCMNELHRLELDDMLAEYVDERPVMGVCLGLQALMSYAEEGDGVHGLDLFPGRVVRFAAADAQPDGMRRKIPHTGWNRVSQQRHHPLWKDIDTASWFHFNHSYHGLPDNPDHIVGTTHYGINFASVLLRDNVFAVQFQPEKSQSPGLQLLANFLEWDGTA